MPFELILIPALKFSYFQTVSETLLLQIYVLELQKTQCRRLDRHKEISNLSI